MNDWMPNRLEVRSFILKATGIIDPKDFACNHNKWLVSVEHDPKEAARWWHWQKDKTEPGEGWVSLLLDGTELMPPSAWTNVYYFWHSTLNVLEDYLGYGAGMASFSDEPEKFSLTKKGRVAFFEIRGTRQVVDPDSFPLELSAGLCYFFNWVDAYVGGLDPSILQRSKGVMGKLQATSTY